MFAKYMILTSVVLSVNLLFLGGLHFVFFLNTYIACFIRLQVDGQNISLDDNDTQTLNANEKVQIV